VHRAVGRIGELGGSEISHVAGRPPRHVLLAQPPEHPFPAAHPLAGYAWLAVGFALYPLARRRAWQAWAAAFAFGTLFGAVQIARGAHFLSHVLWSAWIVWGVNLALLGCLAALSGARVQATARTPRRGARDQLPSRVS